MMDELREAMMRWSKKWNMEKDSTVGNFNPGTAGGPLKDDLVSAKAVFALVGSLIGGMSIWAVALIITIH